MMKRRMCLVLAIGLALAITVGAEFTIATDYVYADDAKKQEVEYNLNWSMEENLKMFKGKFVRITLYSGATMAGTVKEVKNGLVHLEKLSGRDYFDALIRVKKIVAFDTKFRGFR